jgi:hypothetical protein
MTQLYGLVFSDGTKKLANLQEEILNKIIPTPEKILPVYTVTKPEGQFISQWTWFDDYVQQKWLEGVADDSQANP